MQNISGIQAFVKVASTSNFTRAATELRLSVPAISKCIEQLEESLNVRLLNRNPRSVSLTEEDVRYLARVQPLMEHLYSASFGLGDLVGEPRGTLRVSCTQGFGRKFIAPLMPTFLLANPEVEVDLMLEDRYIDFVSDYITWRFETDVCMIMKSLPANQRPCS
jgi:DNA-binding transcriptional LysR family regulator